MKWANRLFGTRISRYGLLSESGPAVFSCGGVAEGIDASRVLGNKLQKQKQKMRELTRLVERNLELTRAVAEKMELIGGADGIAEEDSDVNESSEASSGNCCEALGVNSVGDDSGINKPFSKNFNFIIFYTSFC